MSNEIIDVQSASSDLPMLSDESLLALADKAEKQIAAINKIKSVALRVTNNNDWTDQNGKPYLQVSGAEKVARVFGISWQIDEPVFEQEPDGHFSYTYKGYFTLGGTTIEAIGSRSSKDKFFTKYGYENGEKVALPPSEIDKGDLKKSAYTNCLGNGISRLLGIRNLTWEEVRTGGNIDPTKVARVEYGGKKERGATDHELKCPKCGGPVWDNREKKSQGKLKANAPDAKCKDKNCDGVIWKAQQEEVVTEPKSEDTVPEICVECGKPYVNGACRNGSCPEGRPE